MKKLSLFLLAAFIMTACQAQPMPEYNYNEYDRAESVSKVKFTIVDPSEATEEPGETVNFDDEKKGVLVSAEGFVPSSISLPAESELVLYNVSDQNLVLTTGVTCGDMPAQITIPTSDDVRIAIPEMITCEIKTTSGKTLEINAVE